MVLGIPSFWIYSVCLQQPSHKSGNGCTEVSVALSGTGSKKDGVAFQVGFLVDFKHHGVIPETAFRGDGVAVGSVDSNFETVVLKPVDRIFNGPGVGLGPVLIETNADINIAHPGRKGMAVQKQRRRA